MRKAGKRLSFNFQLPARRPSGFAFDVVHAAMARPAVVEVGYVNLAAHPETNCNRRPVRVRTGGTNRPTIGKSSRDARAVDRRRH